MTLYLDALRQPGRLDGIDVSLVQGTIDWQKVAAAGFRFAVVKVSEGVGYQDPRALANLDGARRAGLYALAYSFAKPSQGKAREQVRRLWDASGDVMPGRAVLDLEGAPDSMPAQEIVRFGEEWVDAWSEYSLLLPVLYTYPHFAQRMQPALASSATLARCPLWMASYRSTSFAWAPSPSDKPPVPKPWSAWSKWQYSGNGGFRVPGVPGDCDRNLFNGDELAFRSFLGIEDRAADVAPIVRPAVPLGRPALDEDVG